MQQCTTIQYVLHSHHLDEQTFPAIMFQIASDSAALVSNIGLVLSQIYLWDNILDYQIGSMVPDVPKSEIETECLYVWHHQWSLRCKG